jgi:hypothetical protein
VDGGYYAYVSAIVDDRIVAVLFNRTHSDPTASAIALNTPLQPLGLGGR